MGSYERISMAALAYLETYGNRAHFRVDDDISSAMGQRRWDAAHQLNRVKLRLAQLRLAAQAASGVDALAR